MPKFRLSLFVSFLLIGLAVGPMAAPAASACVLLGGTGAISGQVKLPGGMPQSFLNVDLYTATGRYIKSISTNTAGRYQFSGTVTAPHIAFRPLFYNNQPTLAPADLVQVTAPGDTTCIDAVFLRGVFLPLIQR